MAVYKLKEDFNFPTNYFERYGEVEDGRFIPPAVDEDVCDVIDERLCDAIEREYPSYQIDLDDASYDSSEYEVQVFLWHDDTEISSGYFKFIYYKDYDNLKEFEDHLNDKIEEFVSNLNPDLSIRYFYDKNTKSWIVQVLDSEGNEIESSYSGDKVGRDYDIKRFAKEYNTNDISKW